MALIVAGLIKQHLHSRSELAKQLEIHGHEYGKLLLENFQASKRRNFAAREVYGGCLSNAEQQLKAAERQALEELSTLRAEHRDDQETLMKAADIGAVKLIDVLLSVAGTPALPPADALRRLLPRLAERTSEQGDR